MRVFRKAPRAVDEDNPYWMSFSDVMSALLIIFILASVALIIQLMEIQEELRRRQAEFDRELRQLQQAEKVRRTIIHEMADLLQQRGIKVTVSENDTVLSIPNEILGFDTAKFEIGPDYRETALEIGKVLSEVIRRDNRVEYLDTIFIEGHTDNRPLLGFMGKGNWGLSAFRAISLWQLWDEMLPEQYQLDVLKNRDQQPLFSVSGYGPTRPVTEKQETEEDYKANRRIDIRFTIRRPSSVEYQRLSEQLEEAVP
ncbi:OmpA/MotB family protein [Microbulbifer thermotolerans]|uniref:OmpA/MotB family protein n=1 Tax=Microbulbifer thermotolerans TaxID=252514 RepID=UPI0022497DBB|nr:OmpA family protein [Microbulbifer thermotolerans]MCX2779245.1 OmpA family protein [Microbulbifer thermotolerans]MCX2803669.1 OmpA family protein [Microbulbifer thermotolerans]MCX2830432.1 OmpA family protein [Microbulbifer thermotolerans]